MAVRVYIRQCPTGAWLAECPTLQSGGRGKTREMALLELKSEIAHDLEMLFNTDIEVIEGAAPGDREGRP